MTGHARREINRDRQDTQDDLGITMLRQQACTSTTRESTNESPLSCPILYIPVNPVNGST